MNPPICLTSHREGKGTDVQQEWQLREAAALKAAGYEIIYTDMPGQDLLKRLSGRDVFIRCYAHEERQFERAVMDCHGKLLVPRAWRANNWYRLIPQIKQWYGRDIGSINLQDAGFGEFELANDVQSFNKFLQYVFEVYARPVHGVNKVFFKADVKGTLQSGLYTYREATEAIVMYANLTCHNRLRELIFANPLRLMPSDQTVHGIEEYRCFIVDAKVATMSLMSDQPAEGKPYASIARYAKQYARDHRHILPRAYCLDIASDHNVMLQVIELNGISATGFFADHDIELLFKKIAVRP